MYGSLSITNEYDNSCYAFNVSIPSKFCNLKNMTIYNLTNFLYVSTLCYRNGLIQCPVNYTSITGYYPNCCKICKIKNMTIYIYIYIYIYKYITLKTFIL